MTAIMAKVLLRDSCDPATPFDCAPVIRMVGATEAEQLAAVHGVVFEEETGNLEPLEEVEAPADWGSPGAGAVPEVEPSLERPAGREPLFNPVDPLGLFRVEGVELSEEEPQEVDTGGLQCPLSPPGVPWDGGPCEVVMGLSEQEMKRQLAKLDLLLETKRLRDEGVS